MSSDDHRSASIAARTAKGAGWIIAWRLATRNIGLISTLILVRLLAPSDFGLVALATGFIAAADALSWIGVEDALIREAKPDRAAYDTAFTLSVLRGLLTAAVILALAQPVSTFFADDRLIAIMQALAIGTLLTGLENIGIVNFRRNLEFHKEFQLQVWSRLAGVATTILTAFVWHSYWALVTGMLVGRVARLIQSYVMSPYRPSLTLRAWRQLIGFSLWTWGLTVLIQLRDRADHAIVGRILGTNAVGSYAVGHEIGTLTTTELAEPLNRALFSGFASAQTKADQRISMYLGSIGMSVVITLPAGVGISMIADPLVHLVLGAKWVAVIDLIEIISIASILSVLTSVGGAFLLSSNGVQASFWLLITSVVIRIPLMIGCVAEWGLVGAAFAAALSLTIDQALNLWVVLPRIGARISQIAARLWRPGVACAGMVALMALTGQAWSPAIDLTTGGLILDILGRSLTGATIYVASLTLLWLAAGRPDGAEHHILTVIQTRRRRM